MQSSASLKNPGKSNITLAQYSFHAWFKIIIVFPLEHTKTSLLSHGTHKTPPPQLLSAAALWLCRGNSHLVTKMREGGFLSPPTPAHKAATEKAVKTSIGVEISGDFFSCEVNILYVDYIFSLDKKKKNHFFWNKASGFFLTVGQ